MELTQSSRQLGKQFQLAYETTESNTSGLNMLRFSHRGLDPFEICIDRFRSVQKAGLTVCMLSTNNFVEDIFCDDMEPTASVSRDRNSSERRGGDPAYGRRNIRRRTRERRVAGGQHRGV